MTLSIFDFDHTLYLTPLPTDINRGILSARMGYNGKGWWSRPEALNSNLFDISPNPWTLSRYNYHSEKGHYKVLMTGRIQKLKDEVDKVINQDGFTFHEYFLADNRRTLDFKGDSIYELVDKLNPTTIYFYDDREEHIPIFREIGDDLEDNQGIDFRLFHVTKGMGTEIEYGKYKLNK